MGFDVNGGVPGKHVVRWYRPKILSCAAMCNAIGGQDMRLTTRAGATEAAEFLKIDAQPGLSSTCTNLPDTFTKRHRCVQ